ncbi:MAG: hypothetical protein QG658_160 [Patescibacteria group bacterium]|nr:hypothetical protein [Patescibacteria group bacterium]
MDDNFTLFDLEVSVEGDPKTFVCSHVAGPAFQVISENLVFHSGIDQFSMYALSALLPLLPAKQRPTHPHDWMTTDALIACPDPYCGAKFRIKRIGETVRSHAESTRVSLDGN